MSIEKGLHCFLHSCQSGALKRWIKKHFHWSNFSMLPPLWFSPTFFQLQRTLDQPCVQQNDVPTGKSYFLSWCYFVSFICIFSLTQIYHFAKWCHVVISNNFLCLPFFGDRPHWLQYSMDSIAYNLAATNDTLFATVRKFHRSI